MSIGAFSLVLHGHLPWVLHHGRWPHGEDWLHEAATETWLPLLEVLERCARSEISPRWTLGLTPILLEQLTSERFKAGLAAFVAEQVVRAHEDAAEFRKGDNGHMAWLADQHAQRFSAQTAQLEAIDYDLVSAFRRHEQAGRIELISSNATHGYHPLILHDRCARAQIRAGMATSTRHLGHTPRGAWLPECAYRPAGPWMPIAVHGDVRDRDGVATVLASAGVQYCFVDAPLFAEARSEAVIAPDGRVVRVGWDHVQSDPGRGWRSPLEPHQVSERGEATGVVVFARCPEVSEQVWSADVGYPGDGRYLEFHKRQGMRGLRYWKVTGRKIDLGGKHAYYPHDAEAAVQEHATHLAAKIRELLRAHRDQTGRYGVVCAPFDAELFGHWWTEGPEFLWQLAQRLHHDPEIDLISAGDAIDRVGVDKVVALPEGTWGAGNDHQVWLNEGLRFYWEVAYRAEDRFLDLWHRAPWRSSRSPGPRARRLLTAAARQLLLLQASDWPFVISTGGAIDYGLRRIAEHAGLFDDLCNGIEDAIAGRPEDPIVRSSTQRAALLDDVFPDLDLEWWQ